MCYNIISNKSDHSSNRQRLAFPHRELLFLQLPFYSLALYGVQSKVALTIDSR
jgi:hypothetical protein